MSEPIQPAMIPEDWLINVHAPMAADIGGGHIHVSADLVLTIRYAEKTYAESFRHALAAVCLHRHPFGFTWEDVDALRRIAGSVRSWELDSVDAPLVLTVADRIAALLPPRDTVTPPDTE